MRFHKKQFSNLTPPLKIKHDITTNTWSLTDSENVLIAENLSQGNAKILELSVNTVGRALAYLNLMIEYESCVDHDERRMIKRLIKERKKLLQIIKDFLEELDIVDDCQDYEYNVKQWAEHLLFPEGRQAFVGHSNLHNPYKGNINGEDDRKSGADENGSCKG